MENRKLFDRFFIAMLVFYFQVQMISLASLNYYYSWGQTCERCLKRKECYWKRSKKICQHWFCSSLYVFLLIHFHRNSQIFLFHVKWSLIILTFYQQWWDINYMYKVFSIHCSSIPHHNKYFPLDRRVVSICKRHTQWWQYIHLRGVCHHCS